MTTNLVDEELAHLRSGTSEELDAVVAFSLLKTHGYLSQLIDAGLRQQRLTASQFNTLLLLRAAGDEGLLMSEIGARLVVTKSNVTGLIDRLERQGLVARCDHEDRRATVVRLAPAGDELLEKAEPRHAALLAELTGCLTDREKQALVRLLTKMRRELRRRRKRSLA